MVKVQISYQKEDEKIKMIKLLSAGANVKKISDPYKSGKFYRVYIYIE